MDPLLAELVDAASRRYPAGYARHFARGKLRFDPVYLALLRGGFLPERGTLLDLGCGQGLLLALIAAAAPKQLTLQGIDSNPRRVAVARRALGGDAHVEQADLREHDFGHPSVIVLIDVLLYLAAEDTDRVIRKAADALAPGGLLLIREPDASAGARFPLTRLSAWFDAARRGSFGRLQYRSAGEWRSALERHGFAVDARPMSERTPFANVLFAARKIRA